jgi:hypothetical protein
MDCVKTICKASVHTLVDLLCSYSIEKLESYLAWPEKPRKKLIQALKINNRTAKKRKVQTLSKTARTPTLGRPSTGVFPSSRNSTT